MKSTCIFAVYGTYLVATFGLYTALAFGGVCTGYSEGSIAGFGVGHCTWCTTLMNSGVTPASVFIMMSRCYVPVVGYSPEEELSYPNGMIHVLAFSFVGPVCARWVLAGF
jgi:hypothetical protein